MRDVIRGRAAPAALAQDSVSGGVTPAGRSALGVLQCAAQEGDHRVAHGGSIQVEKVVVDDGVPVRAGALKHSRGEQQVSVGAVQAVQCLPQAKTIPPADQPESAQGCDDGDVVSGIGAWLI